MITVLPIEQQNRVIAVMEFILTKNHSDIKIQEIMDRFKLSYEEYSMIENLTLPAYKMKNEAESLRTKYNIAKRKLMQKGESETGILKQNRKGEE